MDKNISIHANDISKHFKVFFDKGLTVKERILFRNRRRYEVRQVLDGVSFEIKKGEAVGLIGHNGCGKSTTLKMLSKIMYPDKGTVETQGRISALIELGAGFHPDMSGRENIYINAAIFGLTRAEIDARLQTIIDFSELGSYIDNPVRTYSSGMYMRLAFSVAINVDADILLVDEILAVGDAAFQTKCFNKLREIKAKGTTIVIVSHSLGQVEQICDRSIWIHRGKIRMEGNPRDVHPAYLDYTARHSGNVINPVTEEEKKAEQQREQQGQQPAETSAQESEEQPAAADADPTPEVAPQSETRWGNGDARITNISLLNAEGKEQEVFLTGEKMDIVIEYKVKNPLQNPACGIGIFRNDGIQCYGTNTQIDRIRSLDLGSRGKVTCSIESNLLLTGEYTLDVAIHTEDGFAYDYYRYAKKFKVYSPIGDVGISRLQHEWKVTSK